MIEIGLKLGDTFLLREVEFRVDYINKQRNSITATNINNINSIFRISERFLIGDTTYSVIYVKDKSSRITLKPLHRGY